MSTSSQWDRTRVQTILSEAKDRYGAGWALLSQDQQQNYLDASVLRVVLAQDGDDFKPAQMMVQRLKAALAEAQSTPQRCIKP